MDIRCARDCIILALTLAIQLQCILTLWFHWLPLSFHRTIAPLFYQGKETVLKEVCLLVIADMFCQISAFVCLDQSCICVSACTDAMEMPCSKKQHFDDQKIQLVCGQKTFLLSYRCKGEMLNALRPFFPSTAMFYLSHVTNIKHSVLAVLLYSRLLPHYKYGDSFVHTIFSTVISAMRRFCTNKGNSICDTRTCLL